MARQHKDEQARREAACRPFRGSGGLASLVRKSLGPAPGPEARDVPITQAEVVVLGHAPPSLTVAAEAHSRWGGVPQHPDPSRSTVDKLKRRIGRQAVTATACRWMAGRVAGRCNSFPYQSPGQPDYMTDGLSPSMNARAVPDAGRFPLRS